MRGKWMLVLGTLVLGAIGVGALSMLRRGSAQKPEPPPKAEQRTVYPAEMSLPGTLRPQYVVNVEAEAIGMLESLEADLGEEVHEGQVLARISSQALEAEQQRALAVVETGHDRINSMEAAITAARLAASRARADANRSRRESERTEKIYQRQLMLHREGATPRMTFEKSQRDFETAQTEFRSLDEMARQAEERVGEMVRDLALSQRILADKSKQLEEAQISLAGAEVRAPVSGIVVARNGEVGRQLDPQNRRLFQIAVEPSLLEAVLDPEPPALSRFRAGQPALILSADVPGDGIPGQVTAVENNQVVVEFVSPTPLLKPGMQVQVRVKLEPVG